MFLEEAKTLAPRACFAGFDSPVNADSSNLAEPPPSLESRGRAASLLLAIL